MKKDFFDLVNYEFKIEKNAHIFWWDNPQFLINRLSGFWDGDWVIEVIDLEIVFDQSHFVKRVFLQKIVVHYMTPFGLLKPAKLPGSYRVNFQKWFTRSCRHGHFRIHFKYYVSVLDLILVDSREFSMFSLILILCLLVKLFIDAKYLSSCHSSSLVICRGMPSVLQPFTIFWTLKNILQTWIFYSLALWIYSKVPLHSDCKFQRSQLLHLSRRRWLSLFLGIRRPALLFLLFTRCLVKDAPR